jgi:tripartite-type tricarboxylate transporter receptor subunit TctC
LPATGPAPLGAIAAAGQPLREQDWPRRPARIVVPYAPGSIADETARFAARHLGAAFYAALGVGNITQLAMARFLERRDRDGYVVSARTLAAIVKRLQ